ncbi:Outer membrane protein OmpA [Chryseobacterium soldanellicola]|uniref:Outer membrane protein OmpA n=1 Tax=Chryseobacterium soldanellicola TaxID=311333 RepID=A0A1H0XXW1_9FLAO|nr:OmpA family protein [Chryseobacterium soldanellicola]SDQ07641.1 Outer membrane protein OmpA [Chryseobacterium soldanellicola]
MSLNVIDLIKGQLGPALVSQAASQFGESESGISKAIGGLLPAVVGGLANNSDNPNVLDAISNASSNGMLGNLLNGSNNSVISGLLASIFGDKISGIVNAIATYAGISNNSSSSLLNMVTGATVGTIGKYAADNNLDKSGISNLLNDQKGIVSGLLPAGLSLASLNIGDWDWAKGYKFDNDNDTIKTTSHEEPKIEVTRSTTPTGTYPEKNNDSGGSIWKWLLPLLLLIAVGYFLWKQCEKKETTTTTTVADSSKVATDTATAVAPADTAGTAVTTSKVDENIDLNGTALKGYKGGLEDQMITFLKSDGYKNAANDDALKDKWYDFDHVNFKSGSGNQLEAGSEGQLQNLVAILKAYPDAKIKIGGYTDKTGNEAVNLKISKERANFIKDWLGKQGVGAQVLDAEGYGSQFAKVDAAASDAERASDRKMSVRFAK